MVTQDYRLVQLVRAHVSDAELEDAFALMEQRKRRRAEIQTALLRAEEAEEDAEKQVVRVATEIYHAVGRDDWK